MKTVSQGIKNGSSFLFSKRFAFVQKCTHGSTCLLFCSMAFNTIHCTREEVADKGHILPSMGKLQDKRKKVLWVFCHSFKQYVFSIYGDIVQQPCPFSSLLASLYVSEMEGMGDMVSQSCLRRPWRTGELYCWDLKAQN